LTKQLEVTSGSGIRQRKEKTEKQEKTEKTERPVSAGQSAREVMQTATEQGVPVKIVAYLCLAAFLLAYLFF
jgi:type VI protein secretion system component VasF